MRIVYDSQIFWRQRYGGISRYIAEIAERIARQPGTSVRVLAPLHMNAYLRGMPHRWVRGRAVELPSPLFRFRGVVNEALSVAALRVSGADLVHETYYAPRTVAPPGAKVVLTVYDMIHELRPEEFHPSDRTAMFKRRAVARADHVICISENTRRDLLRIHGTVDPAKVTVIHLGHDFRSGPSDDSVPSPARSELGAQPYLLYVGDRRGYKNFGAMVAAYAASPALRSGVRLVAFGGPPFGAAEAGLAEAHGLTDGQLAHAQGDDDALRQLYTGATALIYPSAYEGFGIPVLEAMSVGCPVVAARASSIPEVAGDAARLFEPAVPGALTRAMEDVVLDEAQRTALRVRGMARAALFSWQRCADETLAVYRRLLQR